MPEPIKRDGKDVKDQVIRLLEISEGVYKDKHVDDPYFDGCRATIKTIKDMVKEIPTEI